jgi:two-component sensor histidine kinase
MMLEHGNLLRRLILARRGHAARLAIALGLVAGATLLRWVIDRGELGVPFSTYYPAILLGALLLDWRYGVLVAALCAFVANRVFMDAAWFAEITPARVVIFALFSLSSGLLILLGTLVRRLLLEVGALMEQQAAYNRELQHRIKNSLAIVQALASPGARATDPRAFYKDFSGRLAALAKANELLSLGTQQDCHLPDLAEQAVAPFNASGRIRLAGSPCTVPKGSCVPVVMALHELCTNALKHGSLSSESGVVDLAWQIHGEGESRQLIFAWHESGGPPVREPTQRGLGSRLLVAQNGIAAVDLDYAADGVRCEILVEGVCD